MKPYIICLWRKRLVLYLSSVLLITFLLVQLSAFLIFSPKQNSDNSSSLVITGQLADRKLPEELLATRETLPDPIVRQFLSIFSRYEIQLISVDKRILAQLPTVLPIWPPKLALCPLFCYKLLTFVVLQEYFEHVQISLFEHLRTEGFRRITIKESDTNQPSNIKHLHHIIGKGSFAVLLTLFYNHRGDFWWRGGFHLEESRQIELLQRNFPQLRPADFTFAAQQGAYDKFSIQKVQVEEFFINFPRLVGNFLKQTESSTFIPCNQTRARLFHQLYGWTSRPTNSFRQAAFTALSRAKMSLDHLGVPFWLSSGTCLGFYRQCDLISYGRDVDIGIFIQYYDHRIVETFIKHGFKLLHKLGKLEDSLELSFVIGGIKLDIFFFYEEHDHMWNGGLQTKSGNKFKYIFPKFTLCWTEFLNLKVRIPCQTERYIEANYGQNWLEPVMNWDWKSSPSNVHENGRWPANEWAEVIQQFKVD